MVILKTAIELVNGMKNIHLGKESIGFVPTMGALHSGHISLINQSKTDKNITICSIFINPTQFNNAQDFEKYPITLDADIALLEKANCDILFLPSVAEMYPNGIEESKKQIFDINDLDTVLEGEFRPGHFQGVSNIVFRLLKIVNPQHLYMGIKDFQQCMVVQKLIENYHLPVQLHICNTLRDTDGLAQSSRNQRLSENARTNANTIYKCLQIFNKNKVNGNFISDKHIAEALLLENNFTLEYIILANAQTLKPLINYDTNQPMVILIAAWLDGIRLIDNWVL